MTAKGRAILEKEKESFKTGAALGATHSAITIRPRAPVKKFGLELNKFFGRGNKAGESAEAAAKDEQRTSLLAEERAEERPPPGPPLSRAEELRARLASKAEALRGGGDGKKSWPSFGGASSGAAPSSAPAPAAAPSAAPPPPPPPPRAAPSAAAPTSAAGGAAGGDSLDALFANLGRR